jgi:tetratricopeptide (TPR) repeat protein
VGVDRDSAVRKAEELVRDGKIELAIDEYARLVDDQPGDVGAANALGDLYAKVGNRPAAVAQFVQIGDSHRDSGFVPKAVAFYKKALKVDPASDHALSQLAQIAVDQELYADATLYMNRLLQRRREQGNEVGVAECLVRLGGFPAATAEAKLAAARASAAHFAQDQTARLWVDAADTLERADRPREAVDALMQAASLEPDDVALRRRVAQACATTGQIDRVRAFLSFDTAGDHPDLLLALAEHAIADGRDDEARRALERVRAVAPERRTEAEAMLAPLKGESAPAPAAHEIPADFVAVDIDQVEDADADGPLDVAAAFGAAGDDDVARLDEPDDAPVAAATTEEAELPAASAQDASANGLDWSALLGETGEAEPDDSADPEAAVGEGTAAFEPEAIAAPAESSPDPVVDDVVDDPVYIEPENEPEIVETIEPEPEPEPEPEAELAPEPEPEPEPAPEPPPEAASDTDAQPEAAAPSDLESIAALTAAAQNPALQFQASAQLGRLLLRRGRGREGIEWLERATQAATSVREQRLDVMYELADALERAGERTRALDVFADLDFDAASYRDVPDRMAALRRALEEGHDT